MKKIVAIIITIITALGFTLGLTGCKKDPYEYNAGESEVHWHDFMLLVNQHNCSFDDYAYDRYDCESIKSYIKEKTNVNGIFILECGEEITNFLPTEAKFEEHTFYYNEISEEHYLMEYFYIGERDWRGYPSASSKVYVRCYIFPVESYDGQELEFKFGGSRKYGRYVNVYVDDFLIAAINILDSLNKEFMADIPQQWWIDYLNNNFKWVQFDEN